MDGKNVIRVKPKTFEDGWADDFRAIGVKIPKSIQETRYTPVNHDPVPFSVEVDLSKRRAVRRIVGVMPNAVYQGHINNWEEFCRLVRDGETES